ncbi:hypothetical protein HRED_06113 [Candidatus Haloredivivus sp. G17]|nr:hypothetical protein HRED_06113 [Candidatus Haloredivivus sp. G17]
MTKEFKSRLGCQNHRERPEKKEIRRLGDIL